MKRLLGNCAEGKRVNITVAAASHIEKGRPECPACPPFHREGIKHAQMCGKRQHSTRLRRSWGLQIHGVAATVPVSASTDEKCLALQAPRLVIYTT